MKDSHWQDTARVYACVQLHTLCFGHTFGEGPGPLLAVRLERNRNLVSLRPVDIEHETGIERRRVRRALAALVTWGYLIRDGENILLWLTPEIEAAETPEVEDDGAGRFELPDDLPEELKRYLKRFRVDHLPPAAVLEQAKPLCESLTEIEGKLRVLLVGEKPAKVTGEVGQKRSKSRTRAAYVKKAKVVPNEQNNNGVVSMESGVLINRKERHKPLSSSSVNGNGKTPMMMDAERSQIFDTLKQYCKPERGAVDAILTNSRAQNPNATVATICEAIHLKGRLAERADNPLGFLIVAVPRAIEGVSELPCGCGGTGQVGGVYGEYCHCDAGRALRRSHGR
jgi:hypothetical protein